MGLIRNGIDADDEITAEAYASEAAERGDTLAQCVFLSIPLRYYTMKSSQKCQKQWSDSIKALSQKLDTRQNGKWYFLAAYADILFHINQGELYKALDATSKLREEADRRQDHYGVFLSMAAIADIYRTRNDIGLSGECYMDAVKYCHEYLPDVDIAPLYVYICNSYRRKSNRTPEDLAIADSLIEKGLSLAIDDRTRGRLYAEKAMSQYGVKDHAGFHESYKECEKYFAGNHQDPSFQQVKYRKHILDQDYDSAYIVAETLPNEYEKYIAYYVIQRARGNYQEALRCYERASHELNLIREEERRGDLADISAQIGNRQLEVSNHQLEQQRTQALNDRANIIIMVIGLICLVIVVAMVVLYLFMRKINDARKELEKKNEELAVACDKARESEELKMAFIQNVSHEIRTPLNAISGFSTILAEEALTLSEEDREQFKELVKYNTNLLTTLIDDILTLSDLESGKYLFDYKTINVNSACSMAIEIAKHRLKPGVTMALDSEVSDGMTMECDEKRLWQILNNLLVNACKYTEHGHITLGVELLGGQRLRFMVTDTGKGIDPEKYATLFDRFTKFDAHVQGTGLGLNICKQLVTKLGGTIKVDPTYKNGARFIVELPVYKEEAED